MTPKQIERVKAKIAKIRKELAADKKRWGGYHDDSRGLRYLPPGLFVKIRDYKGGLRYLRWFEKTFPDDVGYPVFLFEWTLILFKTNNLPDAEKKALVTYSSNSYLLDVFLGKEQKVISKSENSNWQRTSLLEHFQYSSSDAELTDFSEWLESFMKSDMYLTFAETLTKIDIALETEPVGQKRSELVKKKYRLINGEDPASL